MRETIYQKVDRLQRQKDELEAKCKEANRTIRQLSLLIKRQSVDSSVVDGFKETIQSQNNTIKNLQKELSDLESQNQKLNSDLESLREFNKYLQREEKDTSVLELRKNEEEDGQNRLEYFNGGCWEDKWGLPFFDDRLILNINPFNGYRVFFDTQCKLMKLLSEDYNDLWEEKQKQLDKLRLQYDKYLINELTLKEKKNLLGMDIWNEISKDWRIHTIFSDTTEKKPQELPF